MKPANYSPVYAALYPALAEIARAHGYAMAIHGSMARDFDVICIPWTINVSKPRAVINAILKQFDVRLVGGEPSDKEHGRIAYTISIGHGECALDLSFMPILPEKTEEIGEKHSIIMTPEFEYGKPEQVLEDIFPERFVGYPCRVTVEELPPTEKLAPGESDPRD